MDERSIQKVASPEDVLIGEIVVHFRVNAPAAFIQIGSFPGAEIF